LHGVRSDTLAWFRRRVVLNAVLGTALSAQAPRAGLDVVGQARRGIGTDITACHRGEGNQKQQA